MAKVDVITKAGNQLEEAVLELSQLVKMCRALDELDEQPWLFVLGRMGDRVELEAHAYMSEIHVSAMPHLRDLDAIAGKGGMGAMAPMVTKVMAGQSAHSRT